MEITRYNSVDANRLQEVMQKMVVLLPTSAEEVISKQARLLLNSIIKDSPPADKGKTFKRIAFAGRSRLFHALPLPNMIGVRNQPSGKSSARPVNSYKSTQTGTLWLYASPRFLVGVDRENYKLGMSETENRFYYQ
jgi:hypothetical protein